MSEPADQPPAPSSWCLEVHLHDGATLRLVSYDDVLAWSYDPAAGLSLTTAEGVQAFVPIRSLMLLEATPVYSSGDDPRPS